MKKAIILILSLLTVALVQAKEIPIEDFAKKSQFKSARISPDGEHIAFTYEEGSEVKLGIMSLTKKELLTSFDVGHEREVVYFYWVNNERVVLLAGNITGWLDGANKNYRLMAGNIDGTKRKELWDFQRSGLRIISTLDSDPEKVLTTKSHWQDEDVKLHYLDVYKAKLDYAPDSPKAVGENAGISSISVDLNDVPIVAVEYDLQNEDDSTDDVSRLHIKNKFNEWTVLQLPKNRDEVPNVYPLGFNTKNNKFYFASNHDLDHNGVTGLFVLDTETQQIEKLFRHPDVDISGAIRGAEGEVIGAYYEPGYPSYYYLTDSAVAKEVKFHKSLRASFNGADISLSNYSDDGTLTIVRVTSDKNPGDFYLFNRETNKAEYITSSMPHKT